MVCLNYWLVYAYKTPATEEVSPAKSTQPVLFLKGCFWQLSLTHMCLINELRSSSYTLSHNHTVVLSIVFAISLVRSHWILRKAAQLFRQKPWKMRVSSRGEVQILFSLKNGLSKQSMNALRLVCVQVLLARGLANTVC